MRSRAALDPPAARVRRLAVDARPSSATSTPSAATPPTARAATTSTTSSATTASPTARSSTTPCSATEHWTGVHRLLPRTSVHVPARPARRRRRPEVQPDAHVDGRGRRRASAGPCCRDLPGRVAPAATSSSAGRCRSTTCRAQRGVPRQPAAAPRRATGSQFHRVDEDELTRAVRGRARRPLPLPDRGQPFDVGDYLEWRPRSPTRPSERAPPARGSGGGDAGSLGQAVQAMPTRDRRGPRGRHPDDRAGLSRAPRDAGARASSPPGPMDHFALRAANLLVGNPASAAGLEVTLGGFALRFAADATIAVCGADGRRSRSTESRRRCGRAVASRPGRSSRIGIAPGPGLPALRRDRRRHRRPAALRLARHLHDGRRSAASKAGRWRRATASRSARRAADGSGAEAPAGARARPTVRDMGGRGDARPAGRARLPHRGRHGAPSSAAPGRSTATPTGPASGSSPTVRLGAEAAAASPAATRRTSSTTRYPVGAVNVNGDLPVILGPDGPTAGGFVCRGRRSCTPASGSSASCGRSAITFGSARSRSRRRPRWNSSSTRA